MNAYGTVYSHDGLELVRCGELNATDTFVVPEGIKRIAPSACKDSKVGRVIFPDSLEEIGEDAFYNCSQLTKISIPDKVKALSKRAFCHYENLSRVSLPENLIVIADSAFEGCMKLEKINIPSTLRVIGEEAFLECKKIKSIEIAERPNVLNTSDSYVESDDPVEELKRLFPYSYEEIANYEIFIGENAFSSCSMLEEVIIHKTYVFIENYAFSDCKNLKRFITKNEFGTFSSQNNQIQSNPQISHSFGVSSVGDAAFLNCTALETVDIPEGVAYLSLNSYFYCDNLKDIYLPESLEKIIKFGYRWPTTIEVLRVSKLTPVIRESLASRWTISLIALTKTPSDLPANWRVRACQGFLIAMYRNLPMADNIKEAYVAYLLKISSKLFDFAMKNEHVFHQLLQFRAFSLKETDALIQTASESGRVVESAALLAYKNKYFLKEVQERERDKKDEKAFKQLIGLLDDGSKAPERMELAQKFGDPARQHLHGLTFVLDGPLKTIPDVKDMKAVIELHGGIIGTVVTANTNFLVSNHPNTNTPKTLKAHELDITIISEDQFIDLFKTSLDDHPEYLRANLILDKSGHRIVGWQGLSDTVKLPGQISGKMISGVDNPEQNKSKPRTVLVPKGNWHNAREIIVPEGYVTIGEEAFAGCLPEKIVLPDSIVQIRYGAFKGCIHLKKIALPPRITAIETYTFSGCCSLEEVVLPEKLLGISQYAFSGCTALKRIVIPSNVARIHESAFEGSGIKQIILRTNRLGSIYSRTFLGIEDFEVLDSKGNLVYPFQPKQMDGQGVKLQADKTNIEGTLKLQGLNFVVTGEITSFKNREDLKKFIVNHGGKLLESITPKTDYLICNWLDSDSSKNKKAKELGIPVIAEKQFHIMLEKPGLFKIK